MLADTFAAVLAAAGGQEHRHGGWDRLEGAAGALAWPCLGEGS